MRPPSRVRATGRQYCYTRFYLPPLPPITAYAWYTNTSLYFETEYVAQIQKLVSRVDTMLPSSEESTTIV